MAGEMSSDPIKYGEPFFVGVNHANNSQIVNVGTDMDICGRTREDVYEEIRYMVCHFGGTYTIYECRPVETCEEVVVRAAAALSGYELGSIDDE